MSGRIDAELAFDPRDPEQSLTAPGTWKPTRNPALLVAAMVNQVAIDWERVAELADACEAPASKEPT